MLVLSTLSGILSTSVIWFKIFEAQIVWVWVHDDVRLSFISPEANTHFTVTIQFCPFGTTSVVLEINFFNAC